MGRLYLPLCLYWDTVHAAWKSVPLLARLVLQLNRQLTPQYLTYLMARFPSLRLNFIKRGFLVIR